MGIFNGDGGDYVKVPSGKRMFENILKSQLYAHFEYLLPVFIKRNTNIKYMSFQLLEHSHTWYLISPKLLICCF